MAIDTTRIGEAAMELMDKIMERHGDEAEIKTLVLCVDVDDPEVPSGGWGTWLPVVGDEAVAADLLMSVGFWQLAELTERPVWMDAEQWEFVKFLKKDGSPLGEAELVKK